MTWTNNASYATNVYVEHSEGGGSWTAEATLSASAASYTATSVNTAATHQYRVRAYNGIYSGYSTSSVVQLLTPPAAPTVSASVSLADLATTGLAVSWVHNPLDATVQTAATLRYRLVGAASWTSITKTTQTSHTFAAGTLANGGTYEFQVATKGGHATYGPYSTSVLVVASSTPSVTITSPANGAVLTTSSKLAITWSFFDPEGTTQQTWRAYLYRDGQELELMQGTTQTSCTFKTVLSNDASYTAIVRAQDGSGLWSNNAASINVSTDFYLPPVGTLELTFNADQGWTEVSVITPEPVSTEVAPISASVYRNGTLIASDLDPVSTFIDYLPTLGESTYKVVVWSAIPTSSESDEVVLSTESPWVFLNAGPGFATSARLKGNPAVAMSLGRDKTLVTFAGRTKPVEFIGDARAKVYKLSGDVDGFGLKDNLGTWEAFETIADLPAPIAYRDPMGRKAFTSIGDVEVSHDAKSEFASVSMTLTEVDYDE